MEDSTIVTDFNSWTHSLPAGPTEKDYAQLANKLKTYVNSSKFVREGSVIDQYDPQTGKRIKRPITDVVYRQTPMSQGISSQQLRRQINMAILSGNKRMLKDVSKYRFYSGRKSRTSAQIKQTAQELQKQRQRNRRKRVIITAAILGGAGASLGLIPFIHAKKTGQRFTMKNVIQSAKIGGAGLGTGLLATGLIQAVRG